MIRPYLGLLLALMLALTGQSMAVARGSARVAGEVVLCTGQGAVAVQVDENGQPTGPAHICPDCALSLFAMDAGVPQMPVRIEGKGRALRPVARALPVSRDGVASRARGPPLAAHTLTL
jgi:hypothetical protein